jgi:hypothetical protein
MHTYKNSQQRQMHHNVISLLRYNVQMRGTVLIRIRCRRGRRNCSTLSLVLIRINKLLAAGTAAVTLFIELACILIIFQAVLER